ncbi:hypothetical protein IQ10_00359 [Halalkalibacter nanhaiisediminis]|uniref:Uncharacterized protein n=1 Tax=Halalkalibacter nanhaiisediminis TaxID=688079 RepID=A0A562QUX7_9BACI|nr:hypothetical protein IQ10_00359 [Halalkalibacter nanhaiisediminis]
MVKDVGFLNRESVMRNKIFMIFYSQPRIKKHDFFYLTRNEPTFTQKKAGSYPALARLTSQGILPHLFQSWLVRS